MNLCWMKNIQESLLMHRQLNGHDERLESQNMGSAADSGGLYWESVFGIENNSENVASDYFKKSIHFENSLVCPI